MLMSEEDIQRTQSMVTKPNGAPSNEEVIKLIETALAAHRYRRILKTGVMVQNIKGRGLGHTNHCQQLEADFWQEVRGALLIPTSTP
jgi:hypothetical protein